MSAWYDTSLEEEGERRTLDEMSVDCDYGVINYGQKLPSFVVDGESIIQILDKSHLMRSLSRIVIWFRRRFRRRVQ
jgi:hypothetical protein